MPAVLGPVSTVLNELKGIIVASTTFIAQCGLDSVTPADQVFRHSYRKEPEGEVAVPTADLLCPFVILRQEQLQFSYDFARGGCSTRTGTVRMQIGDKYRGSTHQESVEEFDNFYGQLVAEIASTDSRLPGMEIIQVAPPMATERRDNTDYYGYWVVDFDVREGNQL